MGEIISASLTNTHVHVKTQGAFIDSINYCCQIPLYGQTEPYTNHKGDWREEQN